MKVLIGITPQGSISIVSQAWGGKTSDKCLTDKCRSPGRSSCLVLINTDRSFPNNAFLRLNLTSERIQKLVTKVWDPGKGIGSFAVAIIPLEFDEIVAKVIVLECVCIDLHVICNPRGTPIWPPRCV